MNHVAILRKDWGFLEKILSGNLLSHPPTPKASDGHSKASARQRKTIESRWYKNKYRPWDAIKKEDVIYFKNSGELICIKATVKKVIQYSQLNPIRIKQILSTYGRNIGIEKNDMPKFYKILAHKKYCILIFLKNPQKIKPFQINKKGFGAMASWIVIENVNNIKL